MQANNKRSTLRILQHKQTRRDFLKTSALLGGAGLLATQVDWAFGTLAQRAAAATENDYSYDLQEPENIIYSTCLQCHLSCQLKCKQLGGITVKLDGSPYSSQNLLPQIVYDTSPFEAAKTDGKLCPKGHAGIQTLYDPYRLRKVLKRAGPRGSDKWKTIPFDQAIDEIVNGGPLFQEIGENRHVSGFKEVFVLRDAAVAKSLAEDVTKLKKKEMTVAQFQEAHRDHLALLIDPEHPDLGPKNNQFVFMPGRIQHGRNEFARRFTLDSFGSVNFFEHTTICEESRHIATQKMTDQYSDGKWSGGITHMKPDLLNAEFVIFWGTGAFEANFGVTAMAEKVTYSMVNRNMKFAVIDPRLSQTAGKARWWLPVKPGTDGALALAMIRHIIEGEGYDKKYLANANKAAAKADGEPTWSNVAYLVEMKDGRAASLLRADKAGVGDKDQFVVSKDGQLLAVTPGDDQNPVEGDLFVETQVGDVLAKSVMLLLKEEALSRSMEEYAEITGIEQKVIEEVATEFVSHGKKVGIDFYRGPAMHTNGYYSSQAINTLNVLTGVVDWKGGVSKGGGYWHEFGGQEASIYHFSKMHPNNLSKFGVTLTREGWKYEDSTLFAGYPAKRPWYPFAFNLYQEVIPSAADGYPYPIKILWLHKGTPALSTPAGHKFIDILRDGDKIPLFISDDVVIGETTKYADYVFPDLTYLERWGTPHPPPDVNPAGSPVRQPAASPIPEIVSVDGEEMPISMEAMMIAIGKKLGLSGYGADGFGPGMAFHRPEDYFLKTIANIAIGDKKDEAVPDADDAEMELFVRARRHLPKAVFDLGKWQAAVRPEEWRKVVYVLNRGGRFENFDKAYKDDYMGHPYGKMLNIFAEVVAKTKNSMTGQPFSGMPIHEEIKDAAGRPVDNRGYDFHLITFKEIFGTQSRTICTYWANIALQPENKVLINRVDAEKLGMKDGDLVRLKAATNPEGMLNLGNGKTRAMEGRLRVIQGMRPGVLCVSFHYGHWAYGAEDVEIDGQIIKGDPRRGKGLCTTPVMPEDTSVGNVCLTDPIGASAAFYDAMVRVEKA